jgi:hypothetical protein
VHVEVERPVGAQPVAVLLAEAREAPASAAFELAAPRA